MKRVCKSSIEPEALTSFRTATPAATWDDAHNDNSHGKSVPQICREQSLADQFGLCAYCEIEAGSAHPRVEHFHAKSDTSQNWTLQWENMLAVCDGSCSSPERTRPRHIGLHCDAFKNHQIEENLLDVSCEGWILNPLEIQTFPNLFVFDKATGQLAPNQETCEAINVAGNKFATTSELVQSTIDNLNLNADTLCELRRNRLIDINKVKRNLQKKHVRPEDYSQILVERFFGKKWPAFFTTIRCCLGSTAESYLAFINYQG